MVLLNPLSNPVFGHFVGLALKGLKYDHALKSLSHVKFAIVLYVFSHVFTFRQDTVPIIEMTPQDPKKRILCKLQKQPSNRNILKNIQQIKHSNSSTNVFVGSFTNL